MMTEVIVKKAERAALVVGAAGGIGSATVVALAERYQQVIAVSRQPRPPAALADLANLCWLTAAAEEGAIAEAARAVADHCESLPLARVVLATGTLHGDGYRPEKSLRELDAATLGHLYQVNAVLPLLWLAALEPLLRRSDGATVAVLSARVGSIADNRLGGWYGYRASKAALNMLLRSAAVELGRRAPQVALLAFHPGTTDTALSKPFQARVPEGRLFSPASVAIALLERMDAAQADGELHFVDYAGESIPW
ncbi:SDR family NAD(P)-dependent oxidoreductase [Pseudohaliea rubra]|uniref:Short chain dehydrogenase n=1 Tax=Pseudohaliea rubra DSM 19751 TaxID=1265313 RepID=A0A095VRU0_9GAMM|nr:SDR family NAD(P)-dependent oxidoreductase [Pseudohaliea rubra]KGE04152.1 Short chain dehydrogenase [Pseudohaliea rubra DSM 19751]